MPRIYLVNSLGEQDITNLISSIAWSGDYQQAARKLDLTVAVSPSDQYLPRVHIGLGNMLRLHDDSDKELFRGYVFAKDKSHQGDTMSVTAYDGLIYLVKSKGTYNFKGQTAEGITQKLCGYFGVQVGNLAKTGITQNLIADGETIYDIIMTAYTTAARKNGKKYMPLMQGGKLTVIEKGAVVAGYTLDAKVNLTEASYSETIENMINRVKIYDDEGKNIGAAENASWVKSFGILQDVYKAEKGKDANAMAKLMLKGMERTASVEALGDISCITGRAVKMYEDYTGMTGLFYIDTDEHKWEDGQHSMSLNLSFRNIMDEKEAQEEKPKPGKPKKTKKKVVKKPPKKPKKKKTLNDTLNIR